MFNIIYVFTTLVSVFLAVLQLLMLVRMALSWLPVDEDSSIANFVFHMTEPVIYPIRLLIERFDSISELPIDLSFIIAFMLLSIVQVMLPVIA